MKDDNTAVYRFRTIDQSASYQLTATDVIIGCRRGLQSSRETIPLTIFDGRRSSWEYTSVPWIGMAVISVLAVIFGVWGLLSPKETGMYAAVALGLITTGLLLPVCLWKHRRLNGVTFTGAHGCTVSVVSHTAPSPEFHRFVEAFAQAVLAAQAGDNTKAFSPAADPTPPE